MRGNGCERGRRVRATTGPQGRFEEPGTYFPVHPATIYDFINLVFLFPAVAPYLQISNKN
jgi:hypothetical protein